MSFRGLSPFDNYEISPCQRLNAEGEPDPNGMTYEVCEPHEADVWTLYGHCPEGGVEAIGDFASHEDAEETFQRITGIPFLDHEEIRDYLQVMRAGPQLLRALGTLLTAMEGLPIIILNGPMCDALNDVRLAALAAERKV